MVSGEFKADADAEEQLGDEGRKLTSSSPSHLWSSSSRCLLQKWPLQKPQSPTMRCDAEGQSLKVHLVLLTTILGGETLIAGNEAYSRDEVGRSSLRNLESVGRGARFVVVVVVVLCCKKRGGMRITMECRTTLIDSMTGWGREYLWRVKQGKQEKTNRHERRGAAKILIPFARLRKVRIFVTCQRRGTLAALGLAERWGNWARFNDVGSADWTGKAEKAGRLTQPAAPAPTKRRPEVAGSASFLVAAAPDMPAASGLTGSLLHLLSPSTPWHGYMLAYHHVRPARDTAVSDGKWGAQSR